MIGERMKIQRKIKGYSITKLASLAGVSKSYLSYIERGIQKNPSLQILSKVAVRLDTSIEYLMGEQSDPSVNFKRKIDKEWEDILKQSIDEGMSKEDFLQVRDYIMYKNWKEGS
ncbi:helix-turn-helix domain-containing protein [Aquibacillus halophilus]|uniref:Helix-turn-helix domain-containing protein n=1 Tax=Aquibacillus halophilus TaxID=930132 RepID=A0A6A8DNH6_9BACI|nr:XRE family transcriptional regulator [Aquibacillus halophilus]MRH44597.1 helix-turn-helix domain-containing protein [Aquibacillus halophilus]